MYLKNISNSKIYNLEEEVYENPITKVWCGRGSFKNSKCFVKILNYGELVDKNLARELLFQAQQEVKVLRKVSECSKLVPRVFDAWDDPKNKCYTIVMSLVPGISLRMWLNSHKKERLQPKDVFVRKCIITQLCEVMRDISKRQPAIVHRDLKPENIHVNFNSKTRRWEVYVVDFGVAALNHIRNVGTVYYQAPEQVGKKNTRVCISNKTDIFAIGQIFYEMLLGTPPQIGVDYLVESGQNQWKKLPEISNYLLQISGMDRIINVLESMTCYNLYDRPTYERIITNLKNIKVG